MSHRTFQNNRGKQTIPQITPIEVRNKAKVFVDGCVKTLAAEPIEWQDAGLLCNGKLRELAVIWAGVDASNSLKLAESTATRAVFEALTKS